MVAGVLWQAGNGKAWLGLGLGMLCVYQGDAYRHTELETYWKVSRQTYSRQRPHDVRMVHTG